MSPKISVAVLEDHQSIIDGYVHRLTLSPHIQIVGTANYASELDQLLDQHPVDVVLLDIHVPTTPENREPYPILHMIRRWLDLHPQLTILVISMLTERVLIQSLLDVGVSGYILKDDRVAVQALGSIIDSVAGGGLYLSDEAQYQLLKRLPRITVPHLTSRQLEVLALCAAYPNDTLADLARRSKVSPSTIRNLLSSTYLRLGVRNRTAAILKARKLGMIPPASPTDPDLQS